MLKHHPETVWSCLTQWNKSNLYVTGLLPQPKMPPLISYVAHFIVQQQYFSDRTQQHCAVASVFKKKKVNKNFPHQFHRSKSASAISHGFV